MAFLTGTYEPIREHYLKYLEYCPAVDTDETLMIGHMPRVASQAYAIRLFPPAKKSWFSDFKSHVHRGFPKVYRDFLLATNGCFVHRLSLYGLAPSMQEASPLSKRDKLQCLDLSLANRSWIKEYKVEHSLFHFGGRALTRSENLGYFMGSGGLIQAARKNGEAVGEWGSFSDFLCEELAAAERLLEDETPKDWWH